MPDALSKTVPIWCTVINRYVSREWTETVFPLDVVSEQEISSIETLVPSFVDCFKVSLPWLKLICRTLVSIQRQ